MKDSMCGKVPLGRYTAMQNEHATTFKCVANVLMAAWKSTFALPLHRGKWTSKYGMCGAMYIQRLVRCHMYFEDIVCSTMRVQRQFVQEIVCVAKCSYEDTLRCKMNMRQHSALRMTSCSSSMEIQGCVTAAVRYVYMCKAASHPGQHMIPCRIKGLLATRNVAHSVRQRKEGYAGESTSRSIAVS